MRICIDLRMPAPSSRFLRPDDDDTAIVSMNCDNRMPGEVSFPAANSVLCLCSPGYGILTNIVYLSGRQAMCVKFASNRYLCGMLDLSVFSVAAQRLVIIYVVKVPLQKRDRSN